MSIIIAESIKDLPDALKILKHEIYKKEGNNKNINIETEKQSDGQTTVKVKCSIRKEPPTLGDVVNLAALDEQTEMSIEATPEIAATVDDLNKLAELKERLLTQEERLKLIVMDYMHLHGKLTFNDRCIATWKSQNRNNFDIKSFKTDFPDMYELYIKESNSRVF